MLFLFYRPIRALLILLCWSVSALAQGTPEGAVKINRAKLEFYLPDTKDFSFSFGGFILEDYTNFFVDHSHLEMSPGSSGRAMRIDLQAAVWKDWNFRAQYDFFGDAVRVRHAWLQYNFSANSGLRLGQQLFTYGFQSSSAITDMPLMERGMFDRAWGVRFQKAVSWYYRHERWVSWLGLFGEDESRDGNPNATYSYNWRSFWQPVLHDGYLLHLGWVANRTSFRNAAEARFRVNPAGVQMSGANQIYLIDTGAIADRDYLYKGGAEIVAAARNLALVTTYNEARVARTHGLETLRFKGYYTDLTWIVTGENFPYNAKTGAYDKMIPNRNFSREGGIGAWGISARYDHLDLNDRDILGGEETDASLAAIWWPNPTFKFMTQYTWAEANKAGTHDNPRLLQVRMQAIF